MAAALEDEKKQTLKALKKSKEKIKLQRSESKTSVTSSCSISPPQQPRNAHQRTNNPTHNQSISRSPSPVLNYKPVNQNVVQDSSNRRLPPPPGGQQPNKGPNTIFSAPYVYQKNNQMNQNQAMEMKQYNRAGRNNNNNNNEWEGADNWF